MQIPIRLTIGIFTSLLLVLAALFFIPSTPMARYHNEIENGRILGASERLPELTIESLIADYSMLPQNNNIKTKAVGSKEPLLLNISPRPRGGDYPGIVIDSLSGAVLWSREENEVRPVASLTKLAAALVFLDNNLGWEEVYTVVHGDRREGGRIYLINGDRVRLRDLFELSLIASANTATMALVRATGLSTEDFVARMNEKAVALGLRDTSFVDPVGFGAANVSTAREIAVLLKAALAQNDIRETVGKKRVEFLTAEGQKRTAYATNLLLHRMDEEEYDIIGGKTGYTKLAGYCFAGSFKDKAGNELISVVLGEDDPNARFNESKKLAGWAFENYKWRE